MMNSTIKDSLINYQRKKKDKKEEKNDFVLVMVDIDYGSKSNP